MPATRHIHTTDPVYAPPVIRAPSPTGSLSTEYGPDEGGVENELNDSEVAKICVDMIRFSKDLETVPNPPPFPLLAPKNRTRDEEANMHLRVMASLMGKVREVEAEELYEGNLAHKLNPAVEDQPSSSDIDAIMRSMLGPSPSALSIPAKQPEPEGDSIANFNGFQPLNGR